MNLPKTIIAIIDDDASLRQALDRVLRVNGYGTDAFASAEEFLASVSSCKAACLIIDINLAGRSGLELAREPAVRALQCPMIFMSGTDDPDLQLQALELTGHTCLRKPFVAVEILWLVAKALRPP